MSLVIISLFVLLTVCNAAVPYQFDPRIVNGESVKLGEIPYQVSLQTKGSEYHFCGGSVLNENYVLTAAHCVNEQSYPIEVVAGTVSLDSRTSVHQVEKMIVHAGYNSRDSWVNDIALIKLKTPFVMSRTVAPVSLPKVNEVIPNNTPAVVSGWGDIHLGGPGTKQLLKAKLYIADQAKCKSTYGVLGKTVRPTQVCANDPSVEKGSCNGDSGGPLTVNGKIVGIVSWSMACALTDYPTVYTRVSSYLDWIKQTAV
ncbi:chymotrypsin-2-like [Hylaeus volcanicus]|uniref:chymotrypsin-2-like n=1 Tax=Hylaeus volcanicus TaxID=313075 RepID=UPI0023B7C33D|nr:chymotrypsin-2-like [Hylaeus volcanicus]